MHSISKVDVTHFSILTGNGSSSVPSSDADYSSLNSVSLIGADNEAED